MSDLSSTSLFGMNKSGSGMNPIFMILILMFLLGGDNSCFCGSGTNSSCGCGGGIGSILPILLPLFLCQGSC